MEDASVVIGGQSLSLKTQLPQRLSTWSGQVSSWIEQKQIAVTLIRYEDLVENPSETFGLVAHTADLSSDASAIERAIYCCRFEMLQHHEREHGFVEKYALDRPFFRKGEVDSWRQVLTESQAQRIISAHSAAMSGFGYL